VRLAAALANAAWLAVGASATRRFHRALGAPAPAQREWLRAQLARHANTRYGAEHDFASITDYGAFARRVPLATWDDLAPWIERVRLGERNVLTADTVTHLATTSGSTGAAKLIPFTQPLAGAFRAAVAPWFGDLVRQRPAVMGGPAYWSISPLPDASAGNADGGVPVGFADDAEYLGGTTARLVRQLCAVPSSVRLAHDEDACWRLSMLALLRTRDLRFVSVWHPSFMELLVAHAATDWRALLEAIDSGENPWAGALPSAAASEWRARPNPARARELQRIGAEQWPRWWPQLQVLSCWGEAAAEGGWRRLAERLPHVLVQRKGLLATEAVVTIPLGDAMPLAVTSHFFEFLDDSGEPRLAHQLERGRRYEVVVTNGGGLWRYRLGDVVECSGPARATPSLRFLGRAGRVSDLRGEKLAEPFVAEVLRGLWTSSPAPAVAFLRARDDGVSAGYELVLSREGATPPLDDIVRRLEAALSANPHYALARRLGQLAPLRAVVASTDAAAEALRPGTRADAMRVGDVKPAILVPAMRPPDGADRQDGLGSI
jgi:hypothetical protein